MTAVILVHGGAGKLTSAGLTAEEEEFCRQGLVESMKSGFEILQKNQSALDAVVAAIAVLENHSYFNAGKGAVFTDTGAAELDAGLMDGSTGNSAGCGVLKTVKNPIKFAEKILHRSPHALIAGPDGDRLAAEWGLEIVDQKYFVTERRWNQLQSMLKEPSTLPTVDHSVEDPPSLGTVGAVALDLHGNLAAGSSTGGLMKKSAGRVSDSSITGCGFYANKNVAVSVTGDGDKFIRKQLSATVAHLMEFGGMDLRTASEKAIFELMKDTDAGLIGVDRLGNFTLPFNTSGMFRGWMTTENFGVAVWPDKN